MIAICLDESGNFEQKENDTAGVFLVAGAVFHGNKASNIDDEEKRIQDWLVRICSAHHAEYPRALHHERDCVDSENVKEVTEDINRKFVDFIKGSRYCYSVDGSYELFLTLGTTDNTPKAYDKKGNLINDNKTSNRYQHVAFSTVSNLLFSTPALESEHSVKLRIATRSLPVTQIANQEEYNAGGYHKGKEDKCIFITNSDTYRGMLLQQLPGSKRTEDNIEVNVFSIDYENKSIKQNFYYLADIVCSVFREITKDKTIEEALNAVTAWAKENDIRVYVRLYDDVDITYNEALRRVRDGDYYTGLKILCDGKKQGAEYEYYEKNLFDHVFSFVAGDNNAAACTYALLLLEEYLNSKDMNTDTAEKIFAPIAKQIERNQENSKYHALLYRTYTVAMALANHRGESEKAKEAYHNACKYRSCCSTEEYVELQNRMCVSLLDSLKPNEALSLCQNTVAYLEYMQDARNELMQDDSIPLHYAFSLSQRGQCKAFLKQYDEANSDFEKALALLTHNKTQAQKTLSYYLHSLIEQGDRETFLQRGKTYFGVELPIRDMTKCFKNLDDTNMMFALFVCMKGMWKFCRDDLRPKDVKSILKFIDNKVVKASSVYCYPACMILKYAAFFALSLTDEGAEQIAGEYMKKARLTLKGETGLIYRIIHNGEQEFERLKNGKELMEQEGFSYMYR